MPALTRFLLWYSSGITLMVAASLWSWPHALAALLAALAALAAVSGGDELRTQARAGLPLFVAGALLGGLALEQRQADCRRLLRDGAAVQVHGALQETTERAAVLSLEAIGRTACSGPVRLLLGRAQRPGALEPGMRVRVQGTWRRDLNAGPLDLPRGALAVERLERLAGTRLAPALRGRTSERITQLFGSEAPLAAALLIAERADIDPRVKQDFAASGLAHLLAISGTHVALVAGVVTLLTTLVRLPVLAGSAVAAAASFAYVLFLGAPYPAVRAVLQIVLVLVARGTQRPAHPLGLIAAAGFAILVYDPLALLDAGFQLSFAGLLGIVLWRKPIIAAQPGSLPLVLRDAVATSVAASLATTPITAFHFGQISIVAVAANLVALPLVTVAVPAAALALAVSAASLPAALFLADGTRLLLARLEYVAAAAARIPGGHVYVTRPTVLFMLAAVLLGRIVWRQLWFLRPAVRRACAFGLSTALLLAAPALTALPGQTIEIHMIDVGQGDAIAVRSERGRWLLIDAGPRSDRYDAGAARVVPFLLRRGARSLDALVLTHPHLDHVGGAPAVLRVLETHFVLDPDSGRGARAALGDSLFQGASPREWRAARSGMRFLLDGITVDVLHPEATFLDAPDDPNNLSVVLRLSYGRFSAIFTGDATARVEESLLERYGAALDADLLKVGHHGSNTSTGLEWLHSVTPRLALISSGRGNRYGHPAPAVLERLREAGTRIVRSDERGHVSLRVFPDGRITMVDP